VAGQKLATLIQQDLVAALGSIDRGAKTPANGLWVLDNTNMTAVLTEVGFLTNPAEEAKLVTPAYQQLAAGAIAKGILDYLGWSTTVYTTE
jgi:N-acetylmuramoyl-L-alanine amidase